MKDGSKKSAAKSKSVEKKTIVVNDLKDPRLKSYNDSLRLYTNTYDKLNNTRPDNIGYDKSFINTLYSGQKIKPIATTLSDGNPIYKKPTQPVVYKKKETLSPKSVEKKPTALNEVVVRATRKAPDSTSVGYAGKYTKFADKDIKEMVKKKQITSIDTSSKKSIASTSYGSADKAELMSLLLKKNKAAKANKK